MLNISFCGASLVPFLFSGNALLLMIMVVVTSIMVFVSYYIGDDVSFSSFQLLKLLFVGLIIIILESSGLLMFFG